MMKKQLKLCYICVAKKHLTSLVLCYLLMVELLHNICVCFDSFSYALHHVIA